MRCSNLIAMALAFACAGIVHADLIDLKDGRSIRGTLSPAGEGQTEIRADDGNTFVVKSTDIVHVTLTADIDPAKQAESEWKRVQARVRNSDSLEAIIDLHKKFLAKFPDQPVSADAQKSQAEYEQLLAQHGVKFRGKWMAQAQVEVTIKQWEESVAPALTAYKAGKLRDALEQVKAILKADEGNPNALALAGLASYRIGGIQQSAAYFKALTTVEPASALGENNFAVVLFQQKAYPEALLHYAKALQAAPDNRLILDNITEALGTYPGDRKAKLYTDLQAQYAPAEARIENQMKVQNLVRFGSTWVTPGQYDQLTAQKRAIKDAMDKLDAQYKNAATQAKDLDDKIDATTRAYNTARSNLAWLNNAISTAVANGTQTDARDVEQRDALSAEVGRLSTQLATLQAQRDQLQQATPQFKQTAEQLKAAAAAADKVSFAGTQRVMEMGEDINPPPPAPVPGAAAPAKADAAAPNIPVLPRENIPGVISNGHEPDASTAQINSTLQRLNTPMNIPAIITPGDGGR